MNLNSPVCRTCLGIISEGKTGYNVDVENGFIKNVRNIREMITFCVPEMDIYISISPSICETCLGVLINLYNFKIRCIRVENAIRSYVVANNVMEGSCVDLSNVVRYQIVEALKDKNCPPDVIREYIGKVNKCLRTPSKNAQGSALVFNPMSQNSCGRNIPSSMVSPQNASSNITLLPNRVSDDSPTISTCLSLQLSYEQSLRPPEYQNAPPITNYLTVSKNLMPEREEPFPFSQQLMSINHFNSNSGSNICLTPNLTRKGPCKLPRARSPPKIDNLLFSSLNLMSTSSGGREEAVLVTPQEAGKRSAKRSRPKTSLDSQNVTSCKTYSNPEGTSSSINNGTQELCPITGIVRNVRIPEPNPSRLRNVRKYLGPKSKRKTNKDVQQNTVIILDDDVSAPTKNDQDVVAKGALVELLKSPGIPKSTINTPDNPEKPDILKKVIIKLLPIDKDTLKRKLTPEDIVDEIRSKRRRLMVKLNTNLPYLHKDKKLIAKVKNDRFFKCMFCNFATLEPSNLRSHYYGYHKVCKHCSYKCDKKPALNQHIDTHHLTELNKTLELIEGNQTELDCHLCKFIGLSIFDLRDHRLRIHIKCDQTGMYKCPFTPCHTEDAMAFNIARHIESKHDNPRRKECPLCNYVASAAYSLKQHVRTHSISNKLICPLCGISCNMTINLKRHMRRKHDAVGEGVAGMVYAPTSGRLGGLTTDEDGRITLDFPRSSTLASFPDTTESVNRTCNFDLPSLSEMLCTQTFLEIPEQEDDCTIVDENMQTKNYENNKKLEKTAAPDESEDCTIISQRQVDIMTVDLSDEGAFTENPSKRLKRNDLNTDRNCDIIEIADEDDFGRSEVSAAQKMSQNTVSRSEPETCSEPSVSGLLPRKHTPYQVNESSNHREEFQDKSDGENICEDTNLQMSHNTKELNVNQSEYYSSSLESDQNIEKAINSKDQVVVLPNNDNASTSSLISNQTNAEEDMASQILEQTDNCKVSNIAQRQKNIESNLITCSESVLIESSDEESNDCTTKSPSPIQTSMIIKDIDCNKLAANQTLNNLGNNANDNCFKDNYDVPRNQMERNIVTNDQPMITDPDQCTDELKSGDSGNQINCISEANLFITTNESNNTPLVDYKSLESNQNNSDNLQDSDNNITISYSETENEEVIQKNLDVEVAKKSNISVRNSEIESENIENSKSSYKSVLSGTNSNKESEEDKEPPAIHSDAVTELNKEKSAESLKLDRNLTKIQASDIIISNLEPEESELVRKILVVGRTKKLEDNFEIESEFIENDNGSNKCVTSGTNLNRKSEKDEEPSPRNINSVNDSNKEQIGGRELSDDETIEPETQLENRVIDQNSPSLTTKLDRNLTKIQDSGIIISDSEPEESELVRKILVVGGTEKLQEKFEENISDVESDNGSNKCITSVTNLNRKSDKDKEPSPRNIHSVTNSNKEQIGGRGLSDDESIEPESQLENRVIDQNSPSLTTKLDRNLTKIQDSDIIISDSEPEESELVRNILVGRTEKLRENFEENISHVVNTDSEIESECNASDNGSNKCVTSGSSLNWKSEKDKEPSPRNIHSVTDSNKEQIGGGELSDDETIEQLDNRVIDQNSPSLTTKLERNLTKIQTSVISYSEPEESKLVRKIPDITEKLRDNFVENISDVANTNSEIESGCIESYKGSNTFVTSGTNSNRESEKDKEPLQRNINSVTESNKKKIGGKESADDELIEPETLLEKRVIDQHSKISDPTISTKLDRNLSKIQNSQDSEAVLKILDVEELTENFQENIGVNISGVLNTVSEKESENMERSKESNKCVTLAEGDIDTEPSSKVIDSIADKNQ